MRDMYKTAPRKCIKCGTILGRPKFGSNIVIKSTYYHTWHIHCVCSFTYVLSFSPTENGVWKLRHHWPLFDEKLELK